MAPLLTGVLLVAIFFVWILVQKREKEAVDRDKANAEMLAQQEAKKLAMEEAQRLEQEAKLAERQAQIDRARQAQKEIDDKLASEYSDLTNWCRQAGAVVSQSATRGDATALKAADGNKDSLLSQGSVAFALPKLNRAEKRKEPAWWMVNFGKNREISKIILTSCTDPSSVKRLSNFAISILNAQKESVYYEEFFTDGKNPGKTFILRMPPGIKGRWLRLELLGENANKDAALTLAEVEVLGPKTAK